MPDVEVFRTKLADNIHQQLTAEQLAEVIITAAMESQYGKAFTFTTGFAKMINTLAQSILTHPELRQQALTLVHTYLEQKNDYSKNRSI
ncbi:hypothetical protein COT42_05395 [Candidatus Saganbacteria bacterium CG08_land_8_20_14_0_20_45_16]|uniref:Uncharacterized protein n=1 Tax=Candidatus Saganbacteria bacterium CG08_land_8_20_14_0_20_45_16 TaxID=2014293 RepID=A0A2H0XWT9_UNCSA|nr:MAG: hypothetical protein COT42_05395 [Candidatus Saganbacteria bacterium CG08_land_8_20_14_0_20_45_16]